MRSLLVAVITLALAGCSAPGPQPSPSSSPLPSPSLPPEPPATPEPPPLPPKLTWVIVVVIDDDGGGGCVSNATIEIVAGQGLGRRVRQANWCSYWDPDINASFHDLVAGDPVTLRASAPGYVPLELTVVPTTGPQRAVTFALSRIR